MRVSFKDVALTWGETCRGARAEVSAPARCHAVAALLAPETRELRVRTPSLETAAHALHLINGRDARDGFTTHVFLVKSKPPPSSAPLTAERFARTWHARIRGKLYLAQSTDADFVAS